MGESIEGNVLHTPEESLADEDAQLADTERAFHKYKYPLALMAGFQGWWKALMCFSARCALGI